MVLSMTSFARRECETELGSLRWELRSVNHRYLDITPRLPEELRQIEPLVRERVGRRLGRGKVECALRYQPSASQAREFDVDQATVLRLADALQDLAALVPDPAPVDRLEILRWPGVMQAPEIDLGPLQEAALELLDQALEEMVASRAREGEKLRAMIEQRLDAIEKLVARVREKLPELRDLLRQRLVQRLGELAESLEPGRLEQEIVLQAQKMDVDEEIDRLGAHVEEVRRVLGRDEPIGRRLDFLMQELNREANTLASKSVDAEVTRISVDLKVLIEQIREQVQNIE